MDKFLIRGGNPLGERSRSAGPRIGFAVSRGDAFDRGNSDPSQRPVVKDLITQRRLLEDLGATVSRPSCGRTKSTPETSTSTKRRMSLSRRCAQACSRSDRCSLASVRRRSLPGGCAIGTRPIDLHLKAFEQLGATVSLEAGDVVARAPKGRLVGADIDFEKVTVTGTENVMMAAALAPAERLSTMPHRNLRSRISPIF